MLKGWKIRDGDGARAGGAFQFERLAVKVTRWRVILAGVGVGSYALGLVAMAPAELIARGARDAVGTVWNGGIALNQGFVLAWRVNPLESIGRLGLAERVTVTGPQTVLGGRALLRPGRLLIEDLNGPASAVLINALAPGLPFTCEAGMRVAIAELAVKGAPAGAGQVRVSPGDCTQTGGGTSSPLPGLTGAVTADAEATILTLTREGSGEALLRARITPVGGVNVTVEPAGVGVFPGVDAALSMDTTL